MSDIASVQPGGLEEEDSLLDLADDRDPQNIHHPPKWPALAGARVIRRLKEEIRDLRQRLAAAEKERDSLREISDSKFAEACAALKIVGFEQLKRDLVDCRAKLSLYESAPSEPEVKEALDWADNWKRVRESRGGKDGESHYRAHRMSEVLARSLRSCQAKLAAQG